MRRLYSVNVIYCERGSLTNEIRQWRHNDSPNELTAVCMSQCRAWSALSRTLPQVVALQEVRSSGVWVESANATAKKNRPFSRALHVSGPLAAPFLLKSTPIGFLIPLTPLNANPRT